MMPDLAKLAILLLRDGLAAVLIAAGAAKLADVSGFATTLVGRGMPGGRRRLLGAAAYAVPILEIALGLLSVSGLWPVVVSFAVLLVTSLFLVLTVWVLSRHRNVACRCFGSLTNSTFSRRGLMRNGAFVVVAAAVWWYELNRSATFLALHGSSFLLLLGYGIFAIAVAHATETLSSVRD